MGQNLSAATGTAYDTGVPEHVIPSYTLESARGELTRWQNHDWDKQLGMFYNNNDYQASVLSKATWNVGAGWTADTSTTLIFENMRGWGKESFDDILFNIEVCAEIGGNGYAQIMLEDNDPAKLINLKPLSPGRVIHVVGKNGVLDFYEYIQSDGKTKRIGVNDMFHLVSFRLGDEITGFNKNHAMERITTANEESFKLTQSLMRFHVQPMVLWKLKTDDTTKINAFILKIQDARKKGSDLIIPDDENLLSTEVLSLPPNAINGAITWRNHTIDNFYRTVAVPQFVQGGGTGTESDQKVKYLSFEQPVKQRQSYIERQIWNQLLKRITLVRPASLDQNAQSLATDEAKDANQGLEFQPGDTTAGVAR